MKKGKWRILSLCVSIAILFQNGMPVKAVEAAPTEASQEKAGAEDKKEKLQKKLSEVNGDIDDLKDAKENLEGSIEVLDTQLSDFSQQLENLSQELKEKKAQIKKMKKSLKKATKDEKEQYEAMKKRIRFMYENGDYAYVEIIFASKNMSDFLNNAEYVSKILEYDRTMLIRYQQTKDLIAQKKSELRKEYEESQRLQAAMEQQEGKAQAVLADKKEQIEQFNAQIDDKELQAAVYASEVEAQNNVLAEIQAQEAAAAAAAQAVKEAAATAAAVAAQKEAEATAAAAAAAESQDESAQAEADQKQAEAEQAREDATAQQQEADQAASANSSGAGGFVWPCPSCYSISSDFGVRESPTEGASSNHMGIDIPAQSGAPIVAAAAGTVVISQYSASAGNYISISHGNGIYTVYMHASALYVSAGQKVSAGETIGAVGSTGYSTGPHLHFAVTVNGFYVNPHNYVG